MTTVTSNEIVNLLEAKHSEDVFVSELKSGPSQGRRYYRLDGWAMKKSWANPRVTGYEIKVSRSDFLRDDKWQQYLDVCDELFFVCPYGLIRKEEVPGNAGLMWVYKNGGGLRTVKKAAYKRAVIPEAVYRYILFSRANITAPVTIERQGKAYWEAWMKKKQEDLEFGQTVARKLSYEKAQYVYKIEEENSKLRKQNEQFAAVKKLIDDNGLTNSWNYEEAVKRKLDQVKHSVSAEFLQHLKTIMHSADKILTNLQEED